MRIKTRCPSCKNDTLVIVESGYLVCSWIDCKQPTAIDDFAALLAAERERCALLDNANRIGTTAERQLSARLETAYADGAALRQRLLVTTGAIRETLPKVQLLQRAFLEPFADFNDQLLAQPHPGVALLDRLAVVMENNRLFMEQNKELSVKLAALEQGSVESYWKCITNGDMEAVSHEDGWTLMPTTMADGMKAKLTQVEQGRVKEGNMDCQHKEYVKLDVVEGIGSGTNQIVRFHQFVCEQCGNSEVYEKLVIEAGDGPQNHPAFKQLEAQLAACNEVKSALNIMNQGLITENNKLIAKMALAEVVVAAVKWEVDQLGKLEHDIAPITLGEPLTDGEIVMFKKIVCLIAKVVRARMQQALVATDAGKEES